MCPIKHDTCVGPKARLFFYICFAQSRPRRAPNDSGGPRTTPRSQSWSLGPLGAVPYEYWPRLRDLAVQKCRIVVGTPTKVRPRSDQGPTTVRRRSDHGPTKVRPRSDQGPTKVRPRSDQGPTKVGPESFGTTVRRFVSTVPDILGLVCPSFRPQCGSKSKILGRILQLGT